MRPRVRAAAPHLAVAPALARSASLATVVVAVGCADRSAPPEPGFLASDSAGVEVVRFDLDGAAPLDLSGEDPLWEVGTGSDAEPGTRLYRVGSVIELSDGRIAIAENSTQQLLLMDPASGAETRVGGSGDGPGEFRALSALFPSAEGGVVALDARRLLLTEFDGAGGLVREETLPALTPTGNRTGFLASGNGARFLYTLPGLPLEPGSVRLEGVLVRIGPVLDTVRTLRGPEVFQNEAVVAGRVIYGASTWLAASPAGAWIGDDALSEVLELDTLGAPVRIVRWSGGVRGPVTQQDRDAFFQQLDQAAGQGGGPAPSTALREILPFAERKPAFGGLLASADGELWIRDPEDPAWSLLQDELEGEPPSEIWTVVRPHAGAVHRVTLPRGFALRSVGRDTLLGVHRDALGVETVLAYAWDP